MVLDTGILTMIYYQMRLLSPKSKTFGIAGKQSSRILKIHYYGLTRQNVTLRESLSGKQNRQERFLLESICVFTKDNLDTASEPIDLLRETLKFCKALFTAQPCDAHARNEFLNCTIPKLSDDVCLITEEELSKAVKAMECNKSPGCDGLMMNFYKHFWPTLGEA